ncbi:MULTISPECIES: type II toxin-antitoxin system prevent-host-death family antitoxin [unclassified Methylobacterium]|uniref:type II toxin-antitoxin system Phd/YefM family antitoxin n=1 Tax=unclassified Methylobacterium TaxID=2615210 RepID=UPI0011C1DA22|nr:MULTISPECIES: type II toxin-antitoxin system prevent-host-death family antitoxin [unclassified Methylobacterium]QEE40267.1 type II toxin-antitoxin system prevent-host-death family antitoxin [Methylobacterium sp. WL1]TXN55977.1 type II toxin-antitoxin system prevent-host-death family antitoxin [Methylobacterium sp. WL2]
MRMSVTDANAQLTELVRRAETGDAVILTCHGRPVVRMVAVEPKPDRTVRRALIEAIQVAASAKLTPGPRAARSQDFLYDPDGLPG